jgi:AraC-like DNA-binding protein
VTGPRSPPDDWLDSAKLAAGFESERKVVWRDTALSVSQIAEMLDYAEASTFTRAFRHWSGSTPCAWRRQALARDPGDKAG